MNELEEGVVERNWVPRTRVSPVSLSRKQLLGAGETIQSYNHQAKQLNSSSPRPVDKKPKLELEDRKEEDIDVVNDTDKQGENKFHDKGSKEHV